MIILNWSFYLNPHILEPNYKSVLSKINLCLEQLKLPRSIGVQDYFGEFNPE